MKNGLLDERHHSYHGYVLRIDGTCGDEIGEFLIAVGKAAHEKHQFHAGMVVNGLSVPVPDPCQRRGRGRQARLKTPGFYMTSVIKTKKDVTDALSDGPHFLDVPTDLTTYRQRGCRRLDASTYETKCLTCIWACRMQVEMIIDHWNPSRKRYRFETFCYGPKSCSFYRAGPKRKVPGRKGMSCTEEDWVDEDATSHRGPDD